MHPAADTKGKERVGEWISGYIAIGVFEDAARLRETRPGLAMALGADPRGYDHTFRFEAAAAAFDLYHRHPRHRRAMGVIFGEMPFCRELIHAD